MIKIYHILLLQKHIYMERFQVIQKHEKRNREYVFETLNTIFDEQV